MRVRSKKLPALLVSTATLLAVGAATPGAPSYAQETPAAATVGEAAPAFELEDLAGTKHSLAASAGKVVVIEWIAAECPFVIKHHEKNDTVRALRERYRDRDVVWLAIASGSAANPDALKPKVDAWQLGCPVLLDRDLAVARRFGAKATPHVFVVDGQGVLRYSGAIDDDPSVEAVGATNHLDNALKAVLDGQPVDPATTAPYGCPIE